MTNNQKVSYFTWIHSFVCQ